MLKPQTRKPRGRGAVVHLDRSKKARQIEAVARDFLGHAVAGKVTLDIGCGNGGISAWLAAENAHYGVDVAQVSDEVLPFADASFDFVVSNHVIEHVADQRRHLREIRRVLRADGCCYLATPNRSSPIMEGHVGNDQVLHYREMGPLLQSCGFAVTEYALDVAARPVELAGEVAWARYVPRTLLKLARPLFPSHIFMLRPA
jgi:2-polyprenyl-3-methyl-5-hydroxy-6-metoxy-1,4-benzoquinol methylase